MAGDSLWVDFLGAGSGLGISTLLSQVSSTKASCAFSKVIQLQIEREPLTFHLFHWIFLFTYRNATSSFESQFVDLCVIHIDTGYQCV